MQGTFPKTDNIPCCETNFNKFKRIETIQSMLLDCNKIKFKINDKKYLSNSQIFGK